MPRVVDYNYHLSFEKTFRIFTKRDWRFLRTVLPGDGGTESGPEREGNGWGRAEDLLDVLGVAAEEPPFEVGLVGVVGVGFAEGVRAGLDSAMGESAMTGSGAAVGVDSGASGAASAILGSAGTGVAAGSAGV